MDKPSITRPNSPEPHNDNQRRLLELVKQKLEYEAKIKELEVQIGLESDTTSSDSIDESQTDPVSTVPQSPDSTGDKKANPGYLSELSSIPKLVDGSTNTITSTSTNNDPLTSIKSEPFLSLTPLQLGRAGNTVIAKTATSKKTEVQELLEGIKQLSPPRLHSVKPTRMTQDQLMAENQRRYRLPIKDPVLQKSEETGQPLTTFDLPRHTLAPSVKFGPVPAREMPTVDQMLREMGLISQSTPQSGPPPLYLVECRIINEETLKSLIKRRARHLLEKMHSDEGEKSYVDRGTQTYVTTVAKPFVAGCVNCRSRDHHVKKCTLPFRPGFCHICGADGFDTDDCIYPHGVEHELALNRCVGCGNDLSLYCPECPDCNIRYKGIVDWLRLNYTTLPTWAIPPDHQYMVDEKKALLTRQLKMKFSDPRSKPNQIRKFLIRENALETNVRAENPEALKIVDKLTSSKRHQATQALLAPYVEEQLEKILKEKPEMPDGAECRVLVPTLFKK